MEAIILAGGRNSRLGDAAQGLPKPLIDVGGRPLCSFSLEGLVEAGVDRVIISCARGKGLLFASELRSFVDEIVIAEEDKPLGRGGGIKHAARFRCEPGPVFVVLGDEIIDLDFAAFVAHHRSRAALATIAVAPLPTPFGVVENDPVSGRVHGFTEAPFLPHWVNAGVYILSEEAIDRLPQRGDTERDLFPVLATEGSLYCYHHDGLWMTVDTPKDLERVRVWAIDQAERALATPFASVLAADRLRLTRVAERAVSKTEEPIETLAK